MSLGLTKQSSPEEACRAMMREAIRRGYLPIEAVAAGSTGKQESGWRMVYHKNGLWGGYYQQDASYPGRDDPNQNILEFLNRLDKKRTSPGHGDIWLNIFWLQQRPGERTAALAYQNGRKAYLAEIQQWTAWAWDQYRAVTGEGPVGAEPVTQVPARRPEFTEIAMFGRGASKRSRPPINFFLHTEEGNGSAKSLAQYCQGQNGVSYHYTVRDRIVYDVVDTDLYSWSVLDANVFSINLCFAGSRAAFTRAQWLEREADIEIAAYLAVQDCIKYQMSTEILAPPYVGAARGGISDHKYVTQKLRIGTHTDVGPNFPWDVFKKYVDIYAGAGTIEDEMSAKAEAQIQAVFDKIMALPDNPAFKGKWPSRARYGNGPDEPVDDTVGMILNTDGNVWDLWIEFRAALGDPSALARVKRNADRGDKIAASLLELLEKTDG